MRFQVKNKGLAGLSALMATVVCVLVAPAASQGQQAASPSAAEGASLFGTRCAGCHEPATGRAPPRTSLASMRQMDITEALTTGVMQPMAGGLSATQIQSLAQFLTAPAAPAQVAAAPAAGAPPAGGRGGAAAGGRGGGAPAPTLVDTMCATNPPITPTASDWSMAGRDLNNSRYNPTPGLRAADVPKLKVKWAFSITGHGNAQPVVIGDWMWMLSRGAVYALDPKTGCVRYKVEATTANGLGARNTPPVFRNALSPSGWMMIVAPGNKAVKALDAQNGHVIWTSEVLETAPSSGITGSPIVSGNQVFVPLTSGQEASGGRGAACCTFRGSLVALDLATGHTQWKSYTVTEPMRTIRTIAGGVQLTGPAGGAIWSAPTPDPKRNLVYVATGDSYTDADTKGADAIIAFDMRTGAIKWNTQVTEKDNFIMNCTGRAAEAGTRAGTNNCPTPTGPDFDFGASPILFTLPGGKQVVLSGQKSSATYGMDPDTGRVLWTYVTGAGSALGGIEWGIAADTRALYAGNSDIVNMFDEAARRGGKDNPSFSEPQPPAKPGLTAINPANGVVLWHIVPPVAACAPTRSQRPSGDGSPTCFNAMSAAPAVIPGAVFEGTVDGWFRAYNTSNGRLLWEDSTTSRTYSTTNGVTNQPGGGIDGNGPTIAGGMVFVTSGHDGAAGVGGNGTNVLLAYSVDGK